MIPPGFKHGPDLFPPEMLKELEARTAAIAKALSSRDGSMVKVAFNLAWVSRNAMYRAYGYNGIADYARDRFDVGRSSCYMLIQTAERYGRYDSKDKDRLLDRLDDAWKDYSISKLSAMLPLTEEQIAAAGITPEMPVREIKKIVKNILKSPDDGQDGNDEDPDIDDYTKEHFLLIYSAGHFTDEGRDLFKRIMNTLKEHPELRLEISYRYVNRNVTI